MKIHVMFFQGVHKGGIQGTVVGKTRLTDGINAFEFASKDGAILPSYAPGAHVLSIVLMAIHGPGRSLILSRDPLNPQPITSQCSARMPGRVVLCLGRVWPSGRRSRSRHPRMTSRLMSQNLPVLLVGWIGVTPMISMAAALNAGNERFAFHYAGRGRAAMAYADELTNLCNDALHLHFVDQPDKALDLKHLMSGVGIANLYICGLRGMIDAARAAVQAAGVPQKQMNVKLFESAAATTDDDAFKVEIASSGAVVNVAAGQSIIDALADTGVDVMYDCQRGDCGICQCDVISGTPDHREVVLSQEERDSSKVMQNCVSRSKIPWLVLDI